MEQLIFLPHGDPGEYFELSKLVKHIKDSYRNYIIQGQQNCSFEDHSKPHSLDFWIRKNHTCRKNTKQATNEVIRAIVQSDIFRESKFDCPDSGKKCKGIQLLENK